MKLMLWSNQRLKSRLNKMLVACQHLENSVAFHDNHADAIGQAVPFVLAFLETLESKVKQVFPVIDEVHILTVHQVFDKK